MRDGSEQVRLQGWTDFYVAYWPSLVSWLKGRGVTSPDAQDLVQGFLERLWKSEGFAERLSPEEGKLRSFLLKSLINWQRERYAHDNRQRRGGDAVHLELDEALTLAREDVTYDLEWAKATLKSACRVLRQEYLARKNEVFFDHALPLIDSRDPGEGRAVAAQIGMTENALNVSLKRLRERLAKKLRGEVAATLVQATPTQVNDEIRHLLEVFGNGASLGEIINSLSSSD